MAGIFVKMVDGTIRNKDGTRIAKVECRAVEGLRGDILSLGTESFNIVIPLKVVEEAVKKVRKSK